MCKAAVPFYTVRDACDNIDRLDRPFLIVKHDVEAKPEKALRIGQIEHQFGITATYYVHAFFLEDPRAVSILKEIESLGHEIGYHYDVLDQNDGDRNKAAMTFEEALSNFRGKGFVIKSVCPHGNPTKKRTGYSSNKDFFLDPQIRARFNDIVDVYTAFPTMVRKNYLYVTDAGYAFSYRDTKSANTDTTEKFTPLRDRRQLVEMICAGHSMIISIHSHRYGRLAFVSAARKWLYKTAKASAAFLGKFEWGRYLLNRFYFIAKKI